MAMWSSILLLLCTYAMECHNMELDEGLLDPTRPIINFRKLGKTQRALQMDLVLDVSPVYSSSANTVDAAIMDIAQQANVNNDIARGVAYGSPLPQQDTVLHGISQTHLPNFDSRYVFDENHENIYPASSGDTEGFFSAMTLGGGDYTPLSSVADTYLGTQGANLMKKDNTLSAPLYSSYGNGHQPYSSVSPSVSQKFTTESAPLADYGVAAIITTSNIIPDSTGLVFSNLDSPVAVDMNVVALPSVLKFSAGNNFSGNLRDNPYAVGDLVQSLQIQPKVTPEQQPISSSLDGQPFGLQYQTETIQPNDMVIADPSVPPLQMYGGTSVAVVGIDLSALLPVLQLFSGDNFSNY